MFEGVSGSLEDALKHALGAKAAIEYLKDNFNIPDIVTLAHLNAIEKPVEGARTTLDRLRVGPTDNDPGSRALQGEVDRRNNIEGYRAYYQNRDIDVNDLWIFNESATGLIKYGAGND